VSISVIDFSTASDQPSPIRVLVARLKEQIKEDRRSIRAEKAEIRSLQHSYGPGGAASLQSRIVNHRLEARARLLIYGVLRGRSWDRIEQRHGEMTTYLKWAIQRVFKEAQDYVKAETGVVVPMVDSITELLK
jgi:hypothetical protein